MADREEHAPEAGGDEVEDLEAQDDLEDLEPAEGEAADVKGGGARIAFTG